MKKSELVSWVRRRLGPYYSIQPEGVLRDLRDFNIHYTSSTGVLKYEQKEVKVTLLSHEEALAEIAKREFQTQVPEGNWRGVETLEVVEAIAYFLGYDLKEIVTEDPRLTYDRITYRMESEGLDEDNV